MRARLRYGTLCSHQSDQPLGDEPSPPPKAAAVHGGIFWRCGYSWSDLFGFSLTEDLGHQLSKVFFFTKKFSSREYGQILFRGLRGFGRLHCEISFLAGAWKSRFNPCSSVSICGYKSVLLNRSGTVAKAFAHRRAGIIGLWRQRTLRLWQNRRSRSREASLLYSQAGLTRTNNEPTRPRPAKTLTS